jgi:hypothetical protein
MGKGAIDLYVGRKRTGVSISPDPGWPKMWRVCQGERVSDMVNLTRAKDAAISWARPKGLRGEKASWKNVQTPTQAGYSDPLAAG